MLQENVEIVLKLGDAWNRSGDDLRVAFQEHLAPDVVAYPLDYDVSHVPAHGRDAVISFYTELRDTWERDELEAEKLVDEGDYVVLALHSHAFIKGTEDAFETRIGIIWRFRDGKISEIRYFRSFDEALEAAGLRE